MLVDYVVYNSSGHGMQPQRQIQVQKRTRILGHMATELVERNQLPVYGLVLHHIIATVFFHMLQEVLGGYGDQLSMKLLQLFLHKAYTFIFHFGRHDIQYTAAFAYKSHFQPIK